MKNKIPFFDYPSIFNSHKEELNRVFNDIGSKGAFILQKELEDFESRVADYVGAKFAVGVGNATDALQMLLIAYGVDEGDEIIFCSHTMVATASAIYFSGAVPIPVEAGEDHLIDPESIEKNITDKTVAILPTQLNGRVANMDKIKDIAEKYNLVIFEDSAQALGAKFKDIFAGCFGVGGCISFYPAKNLGSLGDGGLVICNDEHIYEKLLLLRDHGREKSGEVSTWGFNSRLDNLQAGFLNYFFERYPEVVKRRREIASIYDYELKDVSQLNLPPPPDNSIHFDVFQNYEIEALERNKLQKFLSDKGIGTLIQWGGKPVHQFKKLGFTSELPRTDELFEKLLMLPLNLSITDEEVVYVSSCIKQFYK